MQLSDKAKASLNKVIEQFRTGDLSPVTEIIKIRRYPADVLPAAAWSLANRTIAYMQSGRILDCRGFRQWEEVGRKVIKGARAVFILAPNTIRVDDPDADDGTKTVITGFRTIPVFPVTMTEGTELTKFDYSPPSLPPLSDVAARLGVNVHYVPIEAEPANAWYTPSQQQIIMGTHETATFFHELAHAAHGKIEKLTGGQQTEQETIAEFTAAVLSDLYGIPHTGNAWRYISGYAQDPLTAIYKALSTVEKVLAIILE